MDLERPAHSAKCVTDLARTAGETCQCRSTVSVRGFHFVVTFASHWNTQKSVTRNNSGGTLLGYRPSFFYPFPSAIECRNVL